MSIREIVNEDPKVRIRKVKMTCDDRGDIPMPLQGYNFFYLVVGPPSSGKSTFWVNLINKRGCFYYKKFHKVVIFSKSLHTIAEKIKLDEDRFHNDFSIDDLQKEIDEIEERNESGEGDFRTLIIFDDVITKIKGNMPEFLRIIYNRRHLGLSIILITQKFNKCPLDLRVASSGVILFNPTKNELETIYKEMVNLTRNEFDELIRYVFDKRYNFLYIDRENGKYYKNFNRLEINEISKSTI